MESVSQKDATKFFAVTKFLNDANKLCQDKCVVDFQTKDLSAMEKQCATACLKKQMTIYRDLIKDN
eukprot:CAMPEP_0176376332 /NCGR_PEP_ID=MMETSP0126-20121128/28117_1 /TAXON_ID=141414 ORGANISM="Strombidinopsis acuminatum, Strain SPMC142" /NCGR_SAMPLE_ID=MMETSP0126 /ASSEMBLY_ACC=CAM_ASM_000229 /LENGTH=65 /DNA_ID=CAMNT_0017737733 /DNA_START=21 /DNA_END=218 /DNA_ORIENTATION=-